MSISNRKSHMCDLPYVERSHDLHTHIIGNLLITLFDGTYADEECAKVLAKNKNKQYQITYVTFRDNTIAISYNNTITNKPGVVSLKDLISCHSEIVDILVDGILELQQSKKG